MHDSALLDKQIAAKTPVRVLGYPHVISRSYASQHLARAVQRTGGMTTRETAGGFWGGLDDDEVEADRTERLAHYAELRARRADYMARTGLESPTIDLDEYVSDYDAELAS